MQSYQFTQLLWKECQKTPLKLSKKYDYRNIANQYLDLLPKIINEK